jgi:hypothetical protein
MDPWMPSTVCAIFIMCLISRHSRWCREHKKRAIAPNDNHQTWAHRLPRRHDTPPSVRDNTCNNTRQRAPNFQTSCPDIMPCKHAHSCAVVRALVLTRSCAQRADRGVAKCWSLTRIVMATSVCPSSIAVINAVSPVCKPAPPHTYIHLKNRGNQMTRVPHTHAGRGRPCGGVDTRKRQQGAICQGMGEHEPQGTTKQGWPVVHIRQLHHTPRMARTLVSVSAHAPFSSRNSQVSSRPECAAMCRADRPNCTMQPTQPNQTKLRTTTHVPPREWGSLNTSSNAHGFVFMCGTIRGGGVVCGARGC